MLLPFKIRAHVSKSINQASLAGLQLIHLRQKSLYLSLLFYEATFVDNTKPQVY